MKKQFFLLGAAALMGVAACNDSNTNNATTTDSTVSTTQTNVERKGVEIANFAGRTFIDLKTNKPVKLHWDTVHYYYVDDAGTTPYYYYDPSTKDTFDYWGRRLNSYLTYSNGDYIVDESRLSSTDMTTADTATTSSTNSGDMKVKSTDDKYKEKTDTSKLKVTDDKMKMKKK
jgi:hypothetical protein